MLSAIIAANTEPMLLARTLSSVVPAIPEGVVRDGWIIDSGKDGDIAKIADVAGCIRETGDSMELLPQIAQKCASDWLLILDSGVVLEEGWWRDVVEFMEVLPTLDNKEIVAAGFVHASQKYGAWPRIAEFAVAIASYIPFVSIRPRAIIVRRQTIIGNSFQAFPPKISGKSIILRAKAIAPS